MWFEILGLGLIAVGVLILLLEISSLAYFWLDRFAGWADGIIWRARWGKRSKRDMNRG